jgi:hypothetical protein
MAEDEPVLTVAEARVRAAALIKNAELLEQAQA